MIFPVSTREPDNRRAEPPVRPDGGRPLPEGPDTERDTERDTGRDTGRPDTGRSDQGHASVGPVEYVLPLVAHIEKDEPPARTAALEAAARAVLVLLADERSTSPQGPWHDAVRDWQDHRIRKVVRRARGSEWRKAGTLPGITVDHDGAEVRVYPPIPLDAWPKELAKLQVSGTDLAEPATPAPADPGRAVLWLNPALEMTAGKAMAQVGHGAHIAWMRMGPAARAAWAERDFDLAVRTATPAAWPALTTSGRPVVRDAGFTEIAPGSCTVVADVPWSRFRRGVGRAPGSASNM